MSTPSDVSRQPQWTRWGTRKAAPLAVWFPLSVYAVTRLISAGFMIAAAGAAHRSGYNSLATAWDGDWYRSIATTGYPSSLPTGADGQVGQNAWAFSPAYPLIVRALMAVTGLGFSAVAPALSLVLGAAAMVVVFVLLEQTVSRFYACACVLLTCTFMAAPAMQIGYTESLALLLLASALLLLRRRRYVAVAVLLLLLALTRPVVIAFIPVVIAHGASRWRGRAADPFPPGDRRAVALLTGWCIAATALWPVIVAVCTKDLFGWTKTHEAWRTGPGYGPGMGWPATFFASNGWPALAMLVFVVLLTVGIGLRSGSRAWGPELRAWGIAYPAFLFLTTVPGPSVIRWVLLAFPLLWPFPEAATSTSERRFRLVFISVLAIVGLAMQWVWVSHFLAATMPSLWYP